MGCDVAESTGERDLVLLGDSAGVIAQANGAAKCRNAAYLEQFQFAAAAFDRVRLRYIRRNQNLAGIALGKLDEQAQVQPRNSLSHCRTEATAAAAAAFIG